MKPKFIRCEFCKTKMPVDGVCELAVYRAVIDGEEHVFCCVQAYRRYMKEKESKSGQE